MLQTGQHAPMFALPDADMQTVDVAKLRGAAIPRRFFAAPRGAPF